jgi:integrase
MPKIARPLPALEVKRLTTPGLHPAGTVPGLRLLVKSTGARSWVLRTMVAGRRAELGLGGYPTVPLSQAIERAREALDQIRGGADPAAQRRAHRKTVEQTFRRVAEAYINAHAPGWRNLKHSAQWTATLSTYCYPHFGDKHVRDIEKADILAVLNPIWTTKTETATRVLQRIEQILNYAMQAGHRPEGLNPARWRGNLDVLLPKPSKIRTVKHHLALPIDDAPPFMVRLRACDGMGARALEFAILTAARSGEVRAATWDEIDISAACWNIPGSKMKSGRPHRVPLSDSALGLLEALPRFEGTNLMFPGAKLTPLSDMTLLAVLKRLKVPAVPHGFRSTFRDWSAERGNYPNEVSEMALAHVVAGKAEAAYRRGDLYEKRIVMMREWAAFLRSQAG